MRSQVAKRGRLGVSGSCFGKDVILTNSNLRDLGDAIALTFVQTTCLTQEDIFGLLPDYPLAYHTVRTSPHCGASPPQSRTQTVHTFSAMLVRMHSLLSTYSLADSWCAA